MELTAEFIIIMVALVLFAFVSALKPKVGLIFLFALLPSYLIRFQIFSLPTTFLEGMIIISTVLYLIRSIREGTFFGDFFNVVKQNKILFVLLIIFLLVSALSICYSTNKIAAFGVYKAYFVEPVILLFLFLRTFKEKNDFANLLSGLSFSVIVISVADIFQSLTGTFISESYQMEKRATSFYPYPAALALYLVPLLAIFTILILKRKTFKKEFYALLVLSVVLGLIALFFTKAEGGIVAYFGALFVFGLLTRYRLIVFALTVAFAGIVFLVPITRNSVLPILTFQDVSGEVRLALWEGTINLLLDRPFLGAGLASFPNVYPEYKLDRHVELLLYPHNIVLNFWVEIGLMGLFSFISVVFYFFIKSFQIIKKDLKIRKKVIVSRKVNEILCDVFSWQKTIVVASLCAMVSILIYGLVDVPYFKNDLAAEFFIIIGMVFCVKKKKTVPNFTVDSQRKKT